MPAAPAQITLDLPPPYRAIGLRELGDAFTKAVEVAPDEGAGTLVWTRRFDLVEVAIVLEPEEPLVSARRAFFVAMNAAADALAAHCPPEKPITFGWPGTIMLDGGLIGGGRLAWPANADEHEPPAFLVFGLMLRLMIHSGGRSSLFEARADRTSLEAEGFEILDPARLIESFSRHLMANADRFQTDGFKPIGADYLARLAPEKGTRRGIDGNGDLLVHSAFRSRSGASPDGSLLSHSGASPDGSFPSRSGASPDGSLLSRSGASPDAGAQRRPLVPALQACEWLDRETGEPLL